MRIGNRKKIGIILAVLAVYLIIIALVIRFTDHSQVSLRAENGVLDVRSDPFSEHPYFPVEGGWQFFWKQFLLPGHPEEVSPDLYSSGEEWNHMVLHGEKLPGQGFATYRMTLLHQPGQDLALLVQRIYSSYRIYINGELAAEAGSPGETRETTDPCYITRVIPIDTRGIEKTEILIHTANFEQYKGGLCGYEPIYLGQNTAVRELFQKKSYTFLFLLGFLLMVVAFNLILFFSRPGEKSYLYLALLCLITSLVLMLDMKAFAVTVKYLTSYSFREELNYAVQYAGTILYLLFIQKMFGYEFPPLLMRLCVGAFSAIAILTLTLPAPASMNMYNVFLVCLIFVLAYCFFIVVRAILFGKRSQYIFGIIYILLCMTLIFQSFYYQQQAYILDIIPVLHLLVIVIYIVNMVYLVIDYRRALATANLLTYDLERKVEERTRALEQSREIIEAINGEQKVLLRLLCHDLSNPFISMKFLMDILKKSPQEFEKKRDIYIEEIDRAVGTSIELIDRVRKSANDDEITANPVPVNLYEAVKLAESIGKGLFYRKNITLETGIDEDLTVMAEPSLFVHAILMNLIRNAVKFSRPGSVIRISALREGDRVRVTVRDNGIGMSGERLLKVLSHPSECQQPGTEGETGSGFGLRLVQKFTAMFGGSVRIESEENRGTSVILDLAGGSAVF